NNIFAGTGGGGIFKSINNGTSWTPANKGLANLYIPALAISGINIFAGTAFSGIYVSSDNGNSWKVMNDGLKNLHIASISIDQSNIYLGTIGSGVWTRPISELVLNTETIDEHNELYTYPNPNQGQFQIETNLVDELNIKVFNLIGEVVLNQEINLSESNKKAPIDLTTAGAGIYLIQVSSKNGIVTKKVVVE
ncbi:MAG: T9SS type A sorting domain-containing protein, partial [Saprospiraceae bacterium]